MSFYFNYTANFFPVYNATLSKSTAELLLLDFNSSVPALHLLFVPLPAGPAKLDPQDANPVPESSPDGPMGFPTGRKHWRQLRGMAPSLGEAKRNVCARVVRGGCGL